MRLMIHPLRMPSTVAVRCRECECFHGIVGRIQHLITIIHPEKTSSDRKRPPPEWVYWAQTVTAVELCGLDI